MSTAPKVQAPTDLYALIYVSTLASSASVTAVPDISRAARLANPALGITGLLVFDGNRFCQQLEGSMRTVVELFERISNDARHDHISLLHQGAIAQRHYRQFNVGYPLPETGDTLADIEALQGEAAIAAFKAVAASVYMA